MMNLFHLGKRFEGRCRLMKIAAIQMLVTDNKPQNLAKAIEQITAAANAGADLVVLPEMFLCPYQTELFPQYAERPDGPYIEKLAAVANNLQIWLIAGSIPELDEDGRLYNTSYVINRSGERVARHRKIHLFSINVPGGQVFEEAETLSAGSEATVFETELGKIGLCICFDFRFPELARQMVLSGAQMIIVPGAFNQTTGPAHWELMFRSRAVDNQVFTLGCAPACNPDASYQSFGHSILVDPWGTVVDQLEYKEDLLTATIDFALVESIRQALPLLKNRRTDLY